MVKRPPLSNSEMEIARLLWRLGEASAREVLESLEPGRDLGFSTVQTYLSRLEAKGYVASRIVGRTKLFKSRARPQSVIKDAVNDFVDRLFDGDAMPLLRQLISDSNPSPEQLAALRHLIEELEEKGEHDD